MSIRKCVSFLGPSSQPEAVMPLQSLKQTEEFWKNKLHRSQHAVQAWFQLACMRTEIDASLLATAVPAVEVEERTPGVVLETVTGTGYNRKRRRSRFDDNRYSTSWHLIVKDECTKLAAGITWSTFLISMRMEYTGLAFYYDEEINKRGAFCIFCTPRTLHMMQDKLSKLFVLERLDSKFYDTHLRFQNYLRRGMLSIQGTMATKASTAGFVKKIKSSVRGPQGSRDVIHLKAADVYPDSSAPSLGSFAHGDDPFKIVVNASTQTEEESMNSKSLKQLCNLLHKNADNKHELKRIAREHPVVLQTLGLRNNNSIVVPMPASGSKKKPCSASSSGMNLLIAKQPKTTNSPYKKPLAQQAGGGGGF